MTSEQEEDVDRNRKLGQGLTVRYSYRNTSNRYTDLIRCNKNRLLQYSRSSCLGLLGNFINSPFIQSRNLVMSLGIMTMFYLLGIKLSLYTLKVILFEFPK